MAILIDMEDVVHVMVKDVAQFMDGETLLALSATHKTLAGALAPFTEGVRRMRETLPLFRNASPNRPPAKHRTFWSRSKVKKVMRECSSRNEYIFQICALFAGSSCDAMNGILFCAAREGNRDLCLSMIARMQAPSALVTEPPFEIDFNGMCARAARNGHRELCELGHSLWVACELRPERVARRKEAGENGNVYRRCCHKCIRCSAARGGYFDLCNIGGEFDRDDHLPFAQPAMHLNPHEHEMLGAARGGHYDFCAYMYEQEHRPRAEYMLYNAARGNHRDICELVVAKELSAGLLNTSELYEAVLHGAATNGHIALCEFAISQGARDFNCMLVSAAISERREVSARAYELGVESIRDVLCNCAMYDLLEPCEQAIKWHRQRNGDSTRDIYDAILAVARYAAGTGNMAMCRFAIENIDQEHRSSIFDEMLSGAARRGNWDFCVVAYRLSHEEPHCENTITVNRVLYVAATTEDDKLCAHAIGWANKMHRESADHIDVKSLALTCAGSQYDNASLSSCKRIRLWSRDAIRRRAMSRDPASFAEPLGERDLPYADMLARALECGYMATTNTIRGWMQEDQRM
jgi:hypothetical protein